METAEAADTFHEKGKQLDHGLRSWAGYGALALALVMYGYGMLAVCVFLGLLPGFTRATGDMWHVVVAVLVALFSVPTVLLLAVLRSTSLMRKDEKVDSVHAAVGQKLMGMIEKWIEK